MGVALAKPFSSHVWNIACNFCSSTMFLFCNIWRKQKRSEKKRKRKKKEEDTNLDEVSGDTKVGGLEVVVDGKADEGHAVLGLKRDG